MKAQALPQAPAADRRGSLMLAVAAALCATLCVLLVFASPDSILLYSTVAAMFVACFLPAIVAWRRGKLDYFELVHPFGLLYFINFGIASIWIVNEPRLAYDIHLVPYIPLTAFLSLLAYLCFLAGYYLARNKRGPAGKRAQRRDEVRGPLMLLIAGGAGLLGLMTWARWASAEMLGVTALSGVSSLLGQFGPLFLFAWALAWTLVLSKKATRAQWIAFAILLGPGALVVSRSYLNDKSLAMTLILIPMAAFWYCRRKVPWTSLIAASLIMIFIVFPVFNTYRQYDPRSSVEQRLTMTADTISRWDSDTYLDHSLGLFQRRMSLVNSFAIIVRDVGRWVPYLDTERLFLAPAILFIPRILWPDKPKLTLGREFGYKFRITSPLDTHTHVAPSIPGEFYWHFDLPGSLVGMFVVGLGFGWVYRRYGSMKRDRGPVFRALYIVLLIQLLLIEGGLVGEFAGIVKIILMILLLRWACAKLGALESAAPSKALAANG